MELTSFISDIDCQQGAVRAVRFNDDGNYCITCGSDKTVKLWNPTLRSLLKSYPGHGYEVMDARGSCDNGHLASCGLDKQVFYWDVATGKTLRRYRGHAAAVNSVCFNEDSTVIFSGSVDTTAVAWDVRSRSKDPIQIMSEAGDSVTSVAVTDHEVLTGSADRRVRRYDVRAGSLLEDYVGSSVSSVSFTRDGQGLLISSLSSIVRLLDKETGELLADYEGHKNRDYKIDSVLDHKDSVVLSGSENGFVYAWDFVEGKVLKQLKHPMPLVHSISAHPTEPRLLTACMGRVYFWDISFSV